MSIKSKTVKCDKCGYAFSVSIDSTRLKCPNCDKPFYVFNFSIYLKEVI